MQGQHHPLQGVGYSDRPTPFDHLSRVAMAHGQQQSQQQQPATHAVHPAGSTSTSGQSKRRPASSNGEWGPSPPEHANGSGHARPFKKSRKSSSVVAEGDSTSTLALVPGPGTNEAQQQKKRAKQVLSCSECKRRKIKCDRCQPCSACVKRGTPNDCCWEDAKIEPDRQPFALVDDVDEMRERLSLLERFVNKLPPALTSQSFAELGIESMGPLRREGTDDMGSQGHQMFEDLDKLDNGECTEMYNLPGECFPRVSNPERNSHDNLELLENALMIVTRHPERRRTELTEALTSILAPPPIFVDCSSATRLGLDLVFTEQEFYDERKRSLDKIFRILPDKDESFKAVERYEKGFHWMFTCLHMPSLKAEHKKYWEMRESGRRDEVDPAWLAIYALVLALGWNESAHLSPWMLEGAKTLTPEEEVKKEREAGAFYAASQKLLLLADAHGRPQVRTMQVVMLTACWTVIAAVDSTDWGRFSTMLALAIRTGHTLQLHRLTDDPESMPGDDPAWPPGKNSVKRENALRIWSAFTFYDHLAAISRYSTYMINPDHTTTPMLSNIDSKLLSPTEWKFEPQPDTIATDATLERHKYKLAEISRKTFDMYVTGKKSFNYGAILELDKEYRKILDSMPDTWIHEHKSLEEKDPFLRSRRFGALQSVHNRIVRLHRPFLTKGYAPNSKFSYSTEACIKSAKIVLFCHHNNVGFVIKPLYSHSLSASIVLAADLFHHIDVGTNSAEIESKKENLALALEIFSEEASKRVRSGHLRMIIGQARRILSGLFLEVEKRRARRMARMIHGAGGGSAPPGSNAEEALAKEESFAEILARIAKEDPTAPLALNQPQQHVQIVPAAGGVHETKGAIDAATVPSPNAFSSAPYTLPTPASYTSASSTADVAHGQQSWPLSTFATANAPFVNGAAGGMDPNISSHNVLGGNPNPVLSSNVGYGGGAVPISTDPNSVAHEMFSSNFLSDLGLLSSGTGQLFDYYAASGGGGGGGGGGGAGGAGAGAVLGGPSSASGGSSNGPSPSDSFDLAFFGFGNGGTDGGLNRQDASQVLFNQLTAGW